MPKSGGYVDWNGSGGSHDSEMGKTRAGIARQVRLKAFFSKKEMCDDRLVSERCGEGREVECSED